MDTSRSDDVRPPRGVSPTLRSGPRHKPHDANADEIIRFVREHQRSDVPAGPTAAAAAGLTSSVSGLRKKSVLPSIGGRGSHGDVISVHASSDNLSGEAQLATPVPAQSEDVTTSSSLNGQVNVSVSDSGFVDKASEVTDSNSDDSEEAIETPGNNTNNKTDDALFYLQSQIDPFKYKQGVIITRSRTGSILEEDSDFKPLDAHSVFAEDQLVSSRTRRPSKLVDKIMSIHKASSAFKGGTSSPRAPHVTHTQARLSMGSLSTGGGQLFRPRPLPQLPPIANYDIPDRPTAPSPSLTPPSPRSPVDSDREDGDYDLQDYISREHDNETCVIHPTDDENEDTAPNEPIDFIDCR